MAKDVRLPKAALKELAVSNRRRIFGRISVVRVHRNLKGNAG